MTPLLLLASPRCEVCGADLLHGGALLCPACSALRSAPQPADCSRCGGRLVCGACGCPVRPTPGRRTPSVDAERCRMREAQAEVVGAWAERWVGPMLVGLIAVVSAIAWMLRWWR